MIELFLKLFRQAEGICEIPLERYWEARIQSRNTLALYLHYNTICSIAFHAVLHYLPKADKRMKSRVAFPLTCVHPAVKAPCFLHPKGVSQVLRPSSKIPLGQRLPPITRNQNLVL